MLCSLIVIWNSPQDQVWAKKRFHIFSQLLGLLSSFSIGFVLISRLRLGFGLGTFLIRHLQIRRTGIQGFTKGFLGRFAGHLSRSWSTSSTLGGAATSEGGQNMGRYTTSKHNINQFTCSHDESEYFDRFIHPPKKLRQFIGCGLDQIKILLNFSVL